MQAYLQECKDSGFDVVELSARLASMPEDDLLRLVEDVHKVRYINYVLCQQVLSL